MIELISYQEAAQAINLKLQYRRLNLYSLEQLLELYFFEKQQVLELMNEIEKLYDIKKLNIAHNFHYKGHYVEHCEFVGVKPLKKEVIERIILFLETKYFVKQYLKVMKVL